MKRELDLSGLKLVYGGLILQLIGLVFAGRMATGLMRGTAGAGILSCVVRAAAIVIILIGLSKLGAASPFFIKAKKPIAVQLILQILLAGILLVAGRREWSIGSITQTARNTVIEMLLAALVYLAVSILVGLFSVRSMLRGCGHVAEQVNDPLFSIKCRKVWRRWYMAYLLTILLVLAGIAMIVTVLRKTVDSGAAGEDLTEAIFTNVTSSVLLVSIIVMVVLVVFLIVHILYIGKIRETYREYHLEEVKPVAAPAATEQRPMFADYVERERRESPEGSAEVPDDGTADGKTIAGRKYRKIAEGPDEEDAPESDDILEIAKLFKKNGKGG